MQRLCPVCNKGFLNPSVVEHHRTIGGRVYRANLDAVRCDACGDALISDEVLEHFELAVSSALTNAEPSGEAFIFMRKAIGLSRAAMAKMLHVPSEVLAGWEVGEQPVEWRAWVLLCLMVAEYRVGSSATRDKLTHQAHEQSAANRQEVVLGHLTTQPTL